MMMASYFMVKAPLRSWSLHNAEGCGNAFAQLGRHHTISEMWTQAALCIVLHNDRGGHAGRARSDAHGHDDVAVAAGFVGERTELAGGLLVLELEADRAIGHGAEKVE